jgi:hypothetical protein
VDVHVGDDKSKAGGSTQAGTTSTVTVSLNQQPLHAMQITCKPSDPANDGTVLFGSAKSETGVIQATTSSWQGLTVSATFSALGCTSIICVACSAAEDGSRRKLTDLSVKADQELFAMDYSPYIVSQTTMGELSKAKSSFVYVYKTDIVERYSIEAATLNLQFVEVTDSFSLKIQVITAGKGAPSE